MNLKINPFFFLSAYLNRQHDWQINHTLKETLILVVINFRNMTVELPFFFFEQEKLVLAIEEFAFVVV